MNGEISLDTNVIIKFFKGDPGAVKIIAGVSSISLTVPVVAELLYAAKNSARKEENLSTYKNFIKLCRVLPITQETADIYSDMRLSLKQQDDLSPEMTCG